MTFRKTVGAILLCSRVASNRLRKGKQATGESILSLFIFFFLIEKKFSSNSSETSFLISKKAAGFSPHVGRTWPQAAFGDRPCVRRREAF